MCKQNEDLSLLEVELLLNEISIEEPLIASMLREMIYKSPTDSMKKSAKEVISNLINEQKSTSKVCSHNRCPNESINSHVISENKLKKYLAKKSDSKVVLDTLELDIRSNPYTYIFKEKPTRSACSFLGYCKIHDHELFDKLDSIEIISEDRLLNLQYLRMLREEISRIEILLNYFEPVFNELKSLNSSDPQELSTDFINTREEKVKNKKNKLNNAKKMYDEIIIGLESNDFYIKTKKYKVKKSNWMFAKFFDLTNDDDKEPFVIFILKEEYQDSSYFYIGTLSNSHEVEIFQNYNPTQCEGKHNLTDLMFDLKEYFLFSSDFKENLSEVENKLLLQNNKINPYCEHGKHILIEKLFN